ncbi:MAG: hypothetical protein ACR2KK_10115 [Acidimicrobiales bacterium]
MSALPVEPFESFTIDTRNAFDAVRLRLSETVTQLLRPLPTPADLAERVEAVVSELESIQRDLLLVYHVAKSEQAGLLRTLTEIDERLAAGWKPEGKPVDDVVARLRAARGEPQTV